MARWYTGSVDRCNANGGLTSDSLVSKILSMKNCKIIRYYVIFLVIGFLSCLCLFALTVTVHTHTAAVDHVQHECAALSPRGPKQGIGCIPRQPSLCTAKRVLSAVFLRPDSWLSHCGTVFLVALHRPSPNFLIWQSFAVPALRFRRAARMRLTRAWSTHSGSPSRYAWSFRLYGRDVL